MLKGIPTVISPDLMKILLEMGHGDEIVLADGNFPAESCTQRSVRSDGHSISMLLDAILKFLPLDQYVELPVSLMDVVPGDNISPVIWEEYDEIIKKYEPSFRRFEYVSRFDFYERAKKAFAIVATGEKAQYANLILKKGVIKDE
ncbi:RbsD/FucU family protein [Neobacillus sp. M.A.Huq-85]|nr:RbsD/FucU domain-containing protein [Neobacillus cucumis]